MEPNEIRAHAERLSEKPADLIKQVLIKANIGILQGALEEAQEHQAELEKLRAEVAALREDAERLDWLASSGCMIIKGSGVYCYWHTSNRTGPERNTTRDAIDAARKGGA